MASIEQEHQLSVQILESQNKDGLVAESLNWSVGEERKKRERKICDFLTTFIYSFIVRNVLG